MSFIDVGSLLDCTSLEVVIGASTCSSARRNIFNLNFELLVFLVPQLTGELLIDSKKRRKEVSNVFMLTRNCSE